MLAEEKTQMKALGMQVPKTELSFYNCRKSVERVSARNLTCMVIESVLGEGPGPKNPQCPPGPPGTTAQGGASWILPPIWKGLHSCKDSSSIEM
jgi:hypothetical protein